MKFHRQDAPPKTRAAIIFVAIIAIVLVVYGGAHYFYSHAVEVPIDANDNTRHEIVVEEGSSASSVGKELAANNLIRSTVAFQMYVRNESLEDKFVPGRFAIRRDQSLEDIVQTLTDPQAAELWITTLEGWRASEIAEYLTQEGHVVEAEFLDCVATCSIDSPVLSSIPDGQALEGYLFPDTYLISYAASPEVIIERMVSNLETKLTAEMRLDIEKQGKTIHEIMTMASILEREVRGAAEQKVVSGILWKRYEAGMGLGADATVLYALGDWKASLTSKSLQIDSPYNTRKYRDLPPGPISNPGLSSIEAAIYPEESEYWYYLNTLDTGEVKYGRTLEEHAENRRNYL